MPMYSDHPLHLGHLKPIASGNNRDVFAHPDDPELIIKIIKPATIDKHSGADASWKKNQFRRFKHYHTFLRECEEHIASHLDPGGKPDFTHTVVGFVTTDLGLGLVTKAERGADGGYARTLADLIARGSFDDEAREALEQFKHDFFESGVIITDVNLRNLVYSHHPEKGSRFVVIDGYGEKNIIPFNSIFKWCHRRSKRKRVNRLTRAVARELLRREKSAEGSPHQGAATHS